jgi:CRP/FNR family transcriptional regulator, cyclic AMP receptor protein
MLDSNGTSKIDEKLLSKFGRDFNKGDVIFTDGDPGNEMFIIYQGKVRIFKRVGDREKTLAILRKGDFFGEIAVLTPHVRTATAECLDDCNMLVFDGKTLETFLKRKTEIAIKMLRRMAERLSSTDEHIESLLIEDNEIKALHTLINMVPIEWRNEKAAESFPVDPQEYLQLTGIEREILKELLLKWKKLELIKIVGKRIIVEEISKLERFREFLEMKNEFRKKRDGIDEEFDDLDNAL